MTNEDYRVNLDVYNGPMDLLLYLIQRDEIDVHDIPIARITEQYCAHVDVLRRIDPDLAGEFLVMAATLMEIKTRMLLPRSDEGAEGEEAFDPRADLVRQLLEYKAFKDAADGLRSAAADQSLRFPRQPQAIEIEDDGKDLEEVQIWDLVEAFNELMKAVGHSLRETEIIYDDTPIELHVADILDRLGREGDMTFRQIFAGRTKRTELVGLFLALLELIRRQAVRAEQEGPFGEIHVFVNPNPPAQGQVQADSAEATGEQAGTSEANAAEPTHAAGTSAAAPAAETGQYVPEGPRADEEDRDDDGGAEAAGTGS